MTAVAFSPPVQPNSSVSAPYVLAQSAVPVLLAPNATWNNSSGSFTLGTALPATFSDGLWIYFSGVGVNSSGGGPTSSGLYWCVMLSTTDGQAYALQAINIVTSVLVTLATSAFIPFIPLSNQIAGQLPVTAGSHVQTTSADIPLINITIPAGFMGKNGAFRQITSVSMTNSAGSKSLKSKFGGTTIFAPNGTTVSNLNINAITYNRGLATSQFSEELRGLASPLTNNPSNINTANDASLVYAVQTATATDYIFINCVTIEILPAS